MYCPARRTVQAVAAGGAPAYLFQFAYEIVANAGAGSGASHSSDIPFYFHVLNWTARHPHEDKYILENDAERSLSDQVSTSWFSFAATHAPRTIDGFDWPLAIGSNHSVTVVFRGASDIEAVHDFRSKQCDFWDRVNYDHTPQTLRRSTELPDASVVV